MIRIKKEGEKNEETAIQEVIDEKQRRGVLRAYIEHECAKDVCNPVGIPDTMIFVCDYGVIHRCSQDTCHAQTAGVCRISGASYASSGTSSYDQGDYRTWKSKTADDSVYRGNSHDTIHEATRPLITEIKKEEKGEAPKKKRRYHGYGSRQITSLLSSLLYGSERKDINQRIEQERQVIQDKQMSIYMETARKHRIPIDLVVLVRIRDCAPISTKLKPLCIEPYDSTRVEHYVDIVLQMLKMAYTYVEDITPACASSIALATLYEMRMGYTLDGVELIPRDAYMEAMLPRLADLVHFDIQKRQITQGRGLIEMAFQEARKSSVALKSLAIRVNTDTDENRAEMELRPANARKKKKKRHN